jgi:PAS domain S-box-containing protein
MSTPNPHAASQNLRARAEHRHLLAATLPTDMPADTQRLVQELQIHQLELEMQNEELLLAQAYAEHSRAQYVDLYDFAPVGYCMLAANGILTQLNQQTGKLLGYTRQQLVGRRLALFVAPDEREAFADFLDQLAAAPDQRLTCELAMCRSDETPLFAQFEGVAILATPEHPLAYRLVLLDVTARHLATAELATNEARFRAAFEQSRDGVLLLDDQRIGPSTSPMAAARKMCSATASAKPRPRAGTASNGRTTTR